MHAAYLCVKSSVAEDLSSYEEIKLALQYAGFSPSESLLKKIWSKNSPNGITFEEFLGISSKLKVPSPEDISRVFGNVFGTTDSQISIAQFKQMVLDNSGDLSNSDLSFILQEADVVKNDTVDCGKLGRVIYQTIKELKQLSFEKLEEKSNHQKINCKTFTKRHHKPSLNSMNGSSTWFTSVLKGNFYMDQPALISHQYNLNISRDCVTVVKIEPLLGEDGSNPGSPLDVLAYIFREGPDGARTFIGCTEKKDSEGVNFWQGNLLAGNYLIIPFTNGCHLPASAAEKEPLTLFTRAPGTGQVLLTRQFRALLLKIFEQLDLDASGGLNRQEFNLYNWRTSGEEVQDDEWAVVQSNFSVHNNELTPEGFLDLHQLEAEDSGGAEDDLWLSLQAMGYNKSGQVVGCVSYSISALSQVCNPSLHVCGLRSGGLLLDKAIVRNTMESSEPVRIKNMLDLIKYQHLSRDRACIVLQNKSQRSLKVCVDLTQSSNIITHRKDLVVTLELPAKSAIVAHHILPKDQNLPWHLKCSETLL